MPTDPHTQGPRRDAAQTADPPPPHHRSGGFQNNYLDFAPARAPRCSRP